ncbi:MAG TPA: HAD family hydrolase [Chroococcales cyanobacterium]
MKENTEKSLFLEDRLVSARAIVFDKDGVLLDFPFFWKKMIAARIERVHRRFPLDEEGKKELSKSLGIDEKRVDPHGPLVMASKSESNTIIASFLYSRGLPWVKGREIGKNAILEAEKELSLKDLVLPTPRIAELFEKLKQAGWLLGIATTDDKKNTEELLDYLHIRETVSSVVGSDRVSKGKPHPEMLHLACSELGVAPSEAVMVGDGINDLLMGRNTGVAATVGVLTGVTSREELSPHADLILDFAGQLIDRCL